MNGFISYYEVLEVLASIIIVFGLKTIFEFGWAKSLLSILILFILFALFNLEFDRLSSISKDSQAKEDLIKPPKIAKKDENYCLEDDEDEWSGTISPVIESRPRRENIAIYENVLREEGPIGYAPVVNEISDANGNVLERRLEYRRKEEMEKKVVEETGIFYPYTGFYYPLERSRYPGFYEKCDLDGDGVVNLYELGEMQYDFNKITKKYPEGEIDLIIKEFIK